MSVDKKYNQYARRWRALTFDYDTILAQEALSSTIHCLSATTRLLLRSMLPYTEWPTRYDGEGMDTDKIAGWAAKAAYELGGFMFRQVGCKLQMSCDGGNTWATVFDSSICNTYSSLGMGMQYEGDITIINNNYDGTPGSIDCPDVVYDSGPDDSYRNTALCNTLYAWIESAATAWVQNDQDRDERNRMIANVATLIGSGALAITAILTAGVSTLVAGAIGTAIALAVINVDLTDETAILDPDVIEAVACCMYVTLQGQSMSRSAFQGALDNCAFGAESLEQALSDIIYATLQPMDSYLAFLKLWNENFGYAENGMISNDCLLCPATWTQVFNLQDTILHPDIAVVFGTHVPGSGIEGVCETSGTDRKYAHVSADPGEQFNCTYASINYDLTNGENPSASVQAAIAALVFPATYEALRVWNFNQLFEGTNQIMTWDGEELIDTVISGFLRSSYYSCGGSVTLRKFTLKGTGINPFI